jgi:hypothetical protein
LGFLEWTAALACGYAAGTTIEQCFVRGAFSVGFLTWVEATGLAEWVRSSNYGYPSMIGLHAIGMAIMVGLSLVIDMRLVGLFRGIPVHAMNRLFGVAWIGFGINFVSGSALFTTQATSYVVDVIFMSKMTLVFIGAITAAILQPAVARADAWPGGRIPGSTRAIAGTAMVIWIVAIILGRLTAYL